MRIVRELAAEGNPVAKIAFLTRLSEEAIRDLLSEAAAASTDGGACAPTTRTASTGSITLPIPTTPRPPNADVPQ
jgi:hypothetical protein